MSLALEVTRSLPDTMKLSRTIRDDDVDIDTVDVDILPFYGLNCCYFRVRETVVGQEVNT